MRSLSTDSNSAMTPTLAKRIESRDGWEKIGYNGRKENDRTKGKETHGAKEENNG